MTRTLYEKNIIPVSKNHAPQDWNDAIMVSIFRKGLTDDCGNYRGISKLSIVGKVFERILLNKLLQSITPNILPESQCGFRANRGTVDMISVQGNIKINVWRKI